MTLKIIGLAAFAAMTLTAFVASTASATTLEVGGVAQNGAVTFEAEATQGTVFGKTNGEQSNTCSESKFKGTTSTFTGTKVTGALSTLTFKKCTTEEVVIHAPGQLYVEWTSGTTNGVLFSENGKWTFPTSFGFNLTCETGSGTKLGTLTGATTVGNPGAHAVLDVNAVLNCGFLMPSATWKGTYKFTSPTDLGVVS